MRLESKQQYEGYFWFVPNRFENSLKGNDPLRQMAGTLVIEKNGSIDLTLKFPSWTHGLSRLAVLRMLGKKIPIPRIDGILEKSKIVTLLDCYAGGEGHSLGLDTATYRPQNCVIAHSFMSNGNKGFLEKDKIGFNKLRFCLDGLPQFFDSELNGFVEPEYKEGAFWDDHNKNDYFQHGFSRKTKIEWNEPEPLVFATKNYTLRIELKMGRYGSNTKKTIEQRTWCVLEFPEQLGVETCIEKVEQVKRFFGFLFWRRIGITSLWGYSSDITQEGPLNDDGDVHEFEVPFNLHYRDSDWDAEYNEEKDRLPIWYKDFKDSKGENQFGKYLKSFAQKMEGDDLFSIYLWEYLHLLYPTRIRNSFKNVADGCEYLYDALGYQRPEKDLLKKMISALSERLVGILFRDQDHKNRFRKLVLHFRTAFTHVDSLKVQIDGLGLKEGELLKPVYYSLIVLSRFHYLSLLHNDDDLNKKLMWSIEKQHTFG